MRIRFEGKWLKSTPYPSLWRRVALHLWDSPRDPTVHYTTDNDVSGALAYLSSAQASSSERLTMTHLMTLGLALALRRFPDLNVKVVGRRLYQLPRVDLGMLALVDDGKGLSWFRIREADTLSLEQIATTIREESAQAQARVDSQPKRFSGPLFALTLRAWQALSQRFGLSLERWNVMDLVTVPIFLSSTGMFARFTNCAPAIHPSSGLMGSLVIGAIEKRPVVVDDEIVIRPMMRMVINSDHRIVDAFRLSEYAEFLREFLRDPKGIIEDPSGWSSSGRPNR